MHVDLILSIQNPPSTIVPNVLSICCSCFDVNGRVSCLIISTYEKMPLTHRFFLLFLKNIKQTLHRIISSITIRHRLLLK
uniref:Ovule protein n=1 Tax=Parascaris equorum TaxID=6256 RepID=A0A914RKQ2_PAREQ